MKRNRLLSVLGLGLFAALACGSGDSMSDYVRKSGPAPAGSPASFEADDRGYTVPPDLALIRVEIHGEGRTAEAAAAKIRTGIEQVENAAGTACPHAVVDYSAPRAGDWDEWHGSAEMRVEVDLAGATELAGKMAALDTCMGALDALARPQDKKDDEQLRVAVSSPLFSLKDPSAHAPALWARHAERLERVSDGSAAAALQPQDQRCVSSGTVVIESRSLTALRLALDLQCQTSDTVNEVEVAAAE